MSEENCKKMSEEKWSLRYLEIEEHSLSRDLNAFSHKTHTWLKKTRMSHTERKT